MLPKLWKSTVQKQFTKLTTGEARAVEVQIRFQGHPGGGEGGEGEGVYPETTHLPMSCLRGYPAVCD